MSKSRTESIIELASELLEDIEYQRTTANSQLLKASRLARLTVDEETLNWLQCEISGYKKLNEIEIGWLLQANRVADKEKGTYFTAPLGTIEANIETLKLQLAACRTPDISYQPINKFEHSPLSKALGEVRGYQNGISINISTFSRILTTVTGLIYGFVSKVHNEILFSSMAESIFEQYKSEVDSLLAKSSGDILTKIPSIYSRLAEGDSEAISQALTTCRRLIGSFADFIYPSPGKTVTIDGLDLDVGPDKTKNRLNAYVRERVSSDSRRDRLRQTLTNLWDRTSGGVHADVDTDEARALFLSTYMYLGELIMLKQPVSEAAK